MMRKVQAMNVGVNSPETNLICIVLQKVGPQWLLATLSSLYWRVRSNKRNALDCLKVALTKTPLEYRDVPLISLASIMYELGFVEEASRIADEAYIINKIEPATNFLIALLHENSFGAMYHIKHSLKVDPGYRNGDAELLLKAMACNYKLTNLEESTSVVQNKDQICSSDKERSVSSEGVVCSANGEQCKTASIQCYRAERFAEDNSLMSFEPVPISNLLEKNDNCNHNDPKKGIRSLYSSLVRAYAKNDEMIEGSGNVEPDQSQLETMDEVYKKAIHMKMALDERHEKSSGSNSVNDFYGECQIKNFKIFIKLVLKIT